MLEENIDLILQIDEDIDHKGCLYLGGIQAAYRIIGSQRYKVNYVLTVGDFKFLEFEPQSNIIHQRIPIQDDETIQIKNYFDQSFNFIDNAIKSGNILIHCFAGVSRSATIVIAYFMKKFNKPFDDCLNLVREKRPKINPNIGFRQQLKLYEKEIKDIIGEQNKQNEDEYD